MKKEFAFRFIFVYLCVSVVVFLFAAQGVSAAAKKTGKKGWKKMVMKIESPAFKHEGMLPSTYTCDGKALSPPLKWSGAPENVKSFALINDDPDAPVGLWVHWVIYNIPAATHELHENMPKDAELKNGAKSGKNSWGKLGYGGPCPPSGTHRYFFKLYALDALLNLPSGASKEQVESAMKGHILAEAQLMGKYKRRK